MIQGRGKWTAKGGKDAEDNGGAWEDGSRVCQEVVQEVKGESFPGGRNHKGLAVISNILIPNTFCVSAPLICLRTGCVGLVGPDPGL